MGAQLEVLQVGLLEAAREVLLTGATQTTAEPQQSAGDRTLLGNLHAPLLLLTELQEGEWHSPSPT